MDKAAEFQKVVHGALGALRLIEASGVELIPVQRRVRVVFAGSGPFTASERALLDKIAEAMGMVKAGVRILDTSKKGFEAELREIVPDAAVVFLRRGEDFSGNEEPPGNMETGKRGKRGERGVFREFMGSSLLCTHHPADFETDKALKRETWEDIQNVMALLADTGTGG